MVDSREGIESTLHCYPCVFVCFHCVTYCQPTASIPLFSIGIITLYIPVPVLTGSSAGQPLKHMTKNTNNTQMKIMTMIVTTLMTTIYNNKKVTIIVIIVCVCVCVNCMFWSNPALHKISGRNQRPNDFKPIISEYNSQATAR